MQFSDEEKLNSILGNISDFFHEIDTRHEEPEPKLRHGHTEFDSHDHTKQERELWTQIAQGLKKGGTKKQRSEKKKPPLKTPEQAANGIVDAMKKFWRTHGLTSEEIGRRYEIYIGWYYETRGWKVKYNGAIMGLEDSGIDLICTKGNKILIIQI